MKKILSLFTFVTLLCLMPLTTSAETILNIVSQYAKIIQTSTLYVGEVVLDGQQSFYYMYSEDLTNNEDVFGGVKTSLSVFKDGLYSALVPDIVGKTEELGIAVCSNSAYESMMNSDWKSADKAGQACLPNTTVTSFSSEDLYETDSVFAAKCIGDFEGVTIVDECGQSMAINGILGKLSATNTDYVTYTVENGVLIKYIERHIDYTCEMVTVIYTKVELSSSSTNPVMGDVDGDGTVSVTDVAWIVNYILGVEDDNFLAANADINGDGEIDINDVMGTVSIILGENTPQAYLTCPDNNHPHMINLGLPSGTKWACCNVGADKPEAYGGYYAWGETEEKAVYAASNYQFVCEIGQNEGGGESYYNYRFQYLGDDIAGTSYDVAHVLLGGSWIMPSMTQNQELVENCSSQWTSMNGVNGRLFTGPSGGTIFLPAAGFRSYEALNDAGDHSYYWSSTQSPSYSNNAYRLYFNSEHENWYNSGYRGNGYSVRPVAKL